MKRNSDRPLYELATSFGTHAENALRVWEIQPSGKWASRDVTKADKQKWSDLADEYRR